MSSVLHKKSPSKTTHQTIATLPSLPPPLDAGTRDEPSRIYHSPQANGIFLVSNQGIFRDAWQLQLKCWKMLGNFEYPQLPLGSFPFAPLPEASQFSNKQTNKAPFHRSPQAWKLWNNKKYSDTVSETKEDDPFSRFSQPTHHGYPILQEFPLVLRDLVTFQTCLPGEPKNQLDKWS